jgi:acyl-CoA dehydrogenase
VDADTPGLTIARRMRVSAPHPIAELQFDDCRVSADRRLGEEGDGMRLALGTLDYFRTSVGAAACGLAARALVEARARALSRRQFGSPIADFQLTQAALADMATELEAARLLVYRAAWLKDRGQARLTRESAMAKLFATEAAQRIVDRAVQIHGGIGVEHGSVVERLYREVRALRIYEGTSEIQRLVIAREVLEHG